MLGSFVTFGGAALAEVVHDDGVTGAAGAIMPRRTAVAAGSRHYDAARGLAGLHDTGTDLLAMRVTFVVVSCHRRPSLDARPFKESLTLEYSYPPVEITALRASVGNLAAILISNDPNDFSALVGDTSTGRGFER